MVLSGMRGKVPEGRARQAGFDRLSCVARRRLLAWAFLVIGALLALPLAARAQDPLDDVHVQPAPQEPPVVTNQADPKAEPNKAPAGGSDSTNQGKPPSPEVEGKAALSARSDERIRVDVNLVLVPLTVTDPLNRLVTGLEKDNFSIFENNAPQHIQSFSSEDAPVSIGVIFDLSGSMADKINRARNAIIAFLHTANPQDEFFVIGFNDRPELMEDFTSDVTNIEARLTSLQPGHRTALLDAIYFGINKMKQAKYERKALLVVSDGGDNRSRYTEGEVRSLVRESDVQIFSMGIFDPFAPTREEQVGPLLLHDVSEETGGQMFQVDDPDEMGDIATKISEELRNQYVIGFKPGDARRDGKWRKLKVKLSPPAGLPELTVHARTGYYAPSQ